MRRYPSFLMAAVAVLAASTYLFGSNMNAATSPSFDFDEDGVAYDTSAMRHRSLGFSQPIPDPSDPGNATAITVYLTDRWPNPALSIFRTDVFRRYGSGRVALKLEEGHCGAACDAADESEEEGPCLAVSSGDKWGCALPNLRCNYPRCKTMVTNDEYCRARGFDVREYYTSGLPNTKGYLPLGPRLDAWASLEKVRRKPDFVPKKSSERKYAFNAIFSQNTNTGRRQLARHIKTRKSTLTKFASMAKSWSPNPNDPRNGLLNTDKYAEVLLDSVFTLSPAGHNPECFRLFEAVEAGSIPVLIRNDLHRMRPCRQGLVHWHDAPIIVLGSWWELHDRVEKLMEDPAALDERQRELAEWYEGYWHERISEFEDFMLDSHVPEDGEESAGVGLPRALADSQVEAIAEKSTSVIRP